MKRLLLILAAFFAIGSTGTAQATTVSHVVVIAFENHSRAAVIGNANAPYITSLANTYGQLTRYQNLTHPSLPNYLAVTGGSTAGTTTDCLPSATCGSDGPSIFSQVTWKSYQERMNTNCQLTNSPPYFVKHNPAAYYRDPIGCSTNDVPLPAGVPDMSSDFTFITPDVCHDMHSNSCAGSTCQVCQGDNWLKSYLPGLLNSNQYKSGNTAIVLWWDEGSSTGNLPSVIISPYTHAVNDAAIVNHYDMLFTIQQILGVGCIANSCGQTNFRAAFGI